MDSKERICRLWLSQAALPADRAQTILSVYGSAEALWDSFSMEHEKVLGKWGYGLLKKLRQPGEMDRLQEAIHDAGASLLYPEDDDFPPLLRQIGDPPLLLYVRGERGILSGKNIAVVGSRSPSRYGREMAFSLGETLGRRGVTVVSGFANGIDSEAHGGCVQGGGRTAAVLGSGINQIYPRSNQRLHDAILESGGLILTEYPLGARPMPYYFPQRNRIISGICQGMVLVEGRIKSGGMVTVGHALNQGREVFALPGPVTQEGSQAPHKLIREGARLITCGEDLLEDMGWSTAPAAERETSLPPLDSPLETKVRELLLREELSFQELVERTGLSPQELGAILTMMEIGGIIRKSPGSMYHLM